MDQQARDRDFSKPVVVEPETEAGQIAIFYNAVRQALARETRSSGTGMVLYFDLDGFKCVNDSLGHEDIAVSTSIGIVFFGADHNETAESLIRKADHAMYAAKLSGKGAYRFYIESMNESVS
ncbi:MAG: diguanylate cyclase [Magnetovibrio sp.]|nr:diguanylate cyclase [Magnetovibrio sp.]